MVKPNQISFVATADQRVRLERLSTESGRSVAAIVREAVAQYLDPVAAPLPANALWAILRTPEHWLEFKRLAVEMEKLTTPAPEPVAPRPTWRHNRDENSPTLRPRNTASPAAAAPVDDEEPPF